MTIATAWASFVVGAICWVVGLVCGILLSESLHDIDRS